MSPVIPAFDGPLHTSIDSNTQSKLVIDALINARKETCGDTIQLERTEANQLTRLYRYEIVWTLQRIQHKYGPLLFRIEETDSEISKTLLGKQMNRRFGNLGDFTYRYEDIPDDVPIVLQIFGGFDNWCDAEFHRRSISLKDLSAESLQKVFRTAVAIAQQFELSSDPKVTLQWSPASLTENAEGRRLALTFLTNKDVVKRFEFKYWSGGGNIELEINIKNFQNFAQEINSYFKQEAKTDAAEDPPVEARPRNVFQSIDGLKWEDITIKFVDGHNVRISAKETTITANYKEMGFEDSRNLNPDSQWAFLKILAKSAGEISWQDSVATDTVKKKKQLLSDALKEYFGIDEDPFYPYKDRKAYQIRLTLKPE